MQFLIDSQFRLFDAELKSVIESRAKGKAAEDEQEIPDSKGVKRSLGE